MITSILTVEIRHEQDIVLARQRARHIAELLRFDHQDQVRIATAVSELARNAFQYASGGRVEFQIAKNGESDFRVKVTDRGPGIVHLDTVMGGNYVSPTGMGVGLIGVRRLMDSFEIDAPVGLGTTVVVGKRIAATQLFPQMSAVAIGEALARHASQSPYEEMQHQNQELLAALNELQRRQNELDQANRELEETNRGVVALYAELDEKAESIRRASEVKSRFLSNITHELRTPLNSIVSLASCLMDGSDGELNPEQKKQVNYIEHAAKKLAEMVNDLLDLAKVESGKTSAKVARVEVKDLFSALRGMLRPVAANNPNVSLVIEEPQLTTPLLTDESKLTQILHNFISNALKFTECGEVRARATSDLPGWVTFSVTDTGVGIDPSHHSLIFEEFVQLEGPHQKKFKGTGLGLPLAKSLTELLGGYVTVQSKPGVGSTFAAHIPFEPPPPGQSIPAKAKEEGLVSEQINAELPAILIIDDHIADRVELKKVLPLDRFRCMEAAGGQEGLEIARKHRPAAIFLDIAMPGLDGFSVLDRLKMDERTSDIPVIVHTSWNLSEMERGMLQKKSAGILRKPHTPLELKEALLAAGMYPAANHDRP